MFASFGASPAAGTAASPVKPRNDAVKPLGKGTTAAAATAAGRAATAAVSFTSLAQSFAQLLDVLEHPAEHNLAPKEMGDLLHFLSPRLLANLSSFKPPSAASTAELQGGKVRSSFVDEQGVSDTQQLHDEWKKIILEFSAAMQLDAMQAYHLLETYLHLYHFHPGAHVSGLANGSSRESSIVTLPELIAHYYAERSSMLQCIAALFRIFLDEQHAYYREAVTILRKLTAEGLEEQLLARFKDAAEKRMPAAQDAPTTAKPLRTDNSASSASNMLLEDSDLSSAYADQCVTEQSLLLELLFLLYYDNDAYVDQFQGDTLAQADDHGLSNTARAGQARLVRVYTLLQTHQFGRQQPMFAYLSAKGRATVEWIGHLCVLLGLEVLCVEKLLRVYNFPLQDMIQLIHAQHLPGAQALSDDDYERNKTAAVTLLENSELTFREHPLSDLAFLAQVDASFFEADWNPNSPSCGAGPALSLCGPLNLAWSVALSHVYEYLEDCGTIKQEFGLLGVDPDTQRPTLQVDDFSTEKQIIVQRLEAGLCCGPNPFLLMARILGGVQKRQLQGGEDHVTANLPAFKEIVHELLSALFDSSCFSALSSVGGVSIAPLFPLFALIFHEDASLAFRFWATDMQNPQDRSPLLEQAMALCPHDVSPFLHLLTALAGKTAARPLRFDERGEAYDTSAATAEVDADSVVCANRVYDTLLNMKTYTCTQPADSMLRQLDAQEEYNLLLTAPWLSPDGVQLPANTFGRWVAGSGGNGEPRLVQWYFSYSAWPLLMQRVEQHWKLLRSAVPLSAKEWLEVCTILQLLAKLVNTDAAIYAQLVAHLLDSAAGGLNDTALTLYTPNSSFSTAGRQQTPQRELSLLLLLLRLQTYVSLHAAAILASTNSTQHMRPAQQGNQSMQVDSSFDAVNSSLAPLQSAAGVSASLSADDLLSVVEACSSVLFVGAKHDLQRWLRAFTLVVGHEMSSAGSPLYADVASTNMFANQSLQSRSPAQAAYNWIHLLQRSSANLQAPQGRFAAINTFLAHVATLVLPLYDMSTIQQLRLHARSIQPAVSLSARSKTSVSSPPPSVLPINTSLSPFLSTFDLHALLKFVAESLFVQYDEFAYAQRRERWSLGSHILRFFLLVLANPSAPPSLPTNGAPASSPLHSISLQQYLYTLFLTEPSMLLSLLRPLLLGLALLDRLNWDRAHEGEVAALQDLLVHSFLVLGKLMNLEGQRAAVAPGAGGAKKVSFFSVLLERVAAAQAPTSWKYANRRRGGRFAATPTSLLHAITEYANYTRSVELQSLAIQTIRLLCASGETGTPAANLAAHFQPHTLLLFRATCLKLLLSHSTVISLRMHLLHLLVTLFEKQPSLALLFVSERPPVLGLDADEALEEDDHSLFDILQAYLLTSEELLQQDPQTLQLVMRIVAAVWQAAAANSVGLSDFRDMQHRLRKDIPLFWDKVTHCITADTPLEQEFIQDDTADPSKSAALLSLKQLRHCVWNLVNLELFQTLFGAQRRALDAGLEEVLTSLANSSATPHRYMQLQQAYCRTSEQSSLHRQCLEQLQQYGVDLALLTSLPSVSEQEDGVSSPLYNIDLLTRVLQMDLDVVFESEASAREQSLLVSTRMHEDSTALVVREARVDASEHRQRIEQLILDLRQVNNSLLVADVELQLLKSWRTFVQICLQKQPSLLGIKPKSSLAFEYMQQMSQLLASFVRSGSEGTVAGALLQEASALLVAFLSSALVEPSHAASGTLSAAILVYLSRSQHRNNQPLLDADEKAAGERVFTATNELIASLANTTQQALQTFARTDGSVETAPQGIVPALSAGASAPVSSPPRAHSFDASARISSGWFASRAALNSVSRVSSPLSSRTPALTFVQNLTSASLLLLRWSNQQLLTHFSRPVAPLDAITTPVMVGVVAGGSLTSPVAARRLHGSFSSPALGSTLPPVLEAQKSLSNSTLISAVGEEYGASCRSLLQASAACLAHPLLADTAITTVPLLLQAIDIIQGTGARGAADGSIRHEEDPIDDALSLLRPALPTLLHQFAAMPVAQPHIALKLAQLFCTIAQYERGAEMLVQHSVMLCINTHPIFNPTATPRANGNGAMPYFPSFSPYTPAHMRDPWHQVWLLCLHLVSTLLRSTAAKSTLLTSTGAAPLPNPVQARLVEEVLAFFNTYSGVRLNKVLHLSHAAHHSIGSLEEIDVLTHLLYEFESLGRMWHRANRSLHQTQKQQVLLLTTLYMRLLNDPRALEQRILVVSPDEKADAAEVAGGESSSAEDAPVASTDFAHALTRTASTGVVAEAEPRSITGGPLERQKSEAALAALEKRTWRPLGSASGLGSGASTPRQLSTPTTPRSTSTPSTSHQTPSGDDKSLDGRNLNASLSVNVMLTPVRGASSFLLRSPVVGSMQRDAEHGDPNVGVGQLSGALVADSLHAGQAPQKGKAFFTQRIEYSMALVLRNCVSYLRLVCTPEREQQLSLDQALFSHKIKLVNLNSAHSLMHQPLQPTASAAQGGLASGGSALWMLTNELGPGSQVGLTPLDKLQQIFADLGVLEDDAAVSAAEHEFESDYLELDESRPNADRAFRPPLSILVDFQRYVTRVLSRLFEIQRNSGTLDSTDVQRDGAELSGVRSLLPNSAQLQRGSLAASLSPSSPTIPSIHRLMTYLLEHSLLLFVQHVQLHVSRLHALQRHYLAQVAPMTQQAQYAPYAYAQVEYSPPPAPLHAGAVRVSKHLDAYRERVTLVCHLVSQYLTLVSSPETAPPSLANVSQQTHQRTSTLVLHLLEQLEDVAAGLARHAHAFHKLQQQHAQQLQQQQQQQQQMPGHFY